MRSFFHAVLRACLFLVASGIRADRRPRVDMRLPPKAHRAEVSDPTIHGLRGRASARVIRASSAITMPLRFPIAGAKRASFAGYDSRLLDQRSQPLHPL